MKDVWLCQCDVCGWIGIDEIDTEWLAIDEYNYDCCPECWEKELETNIVGWIVQIDGLKWEFYGGEVVFWKR